MRGQASSEAKPSESNLIPSAIISGPKGPKIMANAEAVKRAQSSTKRDGQERFGRRRKAPTPEGAKTRQGVFLINLVPSASFFTITTHI